MKSFKVVSLCLKFALVLEMFFLLCADALQGAMSINAQRRICSSTCTSSGCLGSGMQALHIAVYMSEIYYA